MTTPQCTANRSDGNRCTKRPMRGGTVCDTHGGMAPQVRAKAAQNILNGELRGLLKTMGTDPVTNPALELAKVAGETVGWKNLLLEKVDALDTLTTTNPVLGEQAKAVVVLFTAALADTAKILTAMTRLGLDVAALGHEVGRASREQAESLSRVLDTVLTGLDLTDEQRAEVPALLRAALTQEGLT